MGINTTEQCWVEKEFFPNKKRENRGRKDSTHSYPSGTEDKRQEPVTSHALHTWTFFFFFFHASFFFSLSRSLQKITDILNKDNKCFRINHQALHDYPAFVIMQWKCVVDVAPGGNVKWLRRSDALPASRCFMFPLRALWKDLLRNNKGHLEHTVSRGWADISKYDEYHAFCVRCLDINPIHFFASGEWRAANWRRSCCWRYICSGSWLCLCTDILVQIMRTVSLQKCHWDPLVTDFWDDC